MAQSFVSLHNAGIVDGLFLSSGIIGGGVRTQDKIIETGELLREKLGFRGYLHLKIMPGAEKAQVERAMQIADRVSINLEAPNSFRLQKLAPRKAFFEELLEPLRWIEEIRTTTAPLSNWKNRWPSSVTQFVVGGAGESDLELLETTEHLYQNMRTSRAYFSRFSPVSETPLEDLSPTPPVREHRLYQASFLLRDYGFSMEELTFDTDGNLPYDRDPKEAWANLNLKDNPIEVNYANTHQLLRLPGIGPKSAAAIIKARRGGKINNLDDLRKIGINPTKASPFILLDGRRPSQQLSLF
jgi:predicted DNA-binding helix-hairpin-helix protein